MTTTKNSLHSTAIMTMAPCPQKAVTDPSPVPSLKDILGLADNARALDKLGGDYGLDITTKRNDASTTHAMRFLRELRHTCPEILQQNESLIVATGSEEDLRGRQLFPQKDVSWTWSRSPFRDPPSPQHYSIRQGPCTSTSYDHSEPEFTFPGEQFQDEFRNKMARSGPIFPSLPASKTNVHADAAVTNAYYGVSSSLDPIAFSSASSNFSLPPRSPLSSTNNAKNTRIPSSAGGNPYYGATHDRQYNYEFGGQQKSRLGEGGPPTQGYGNSSRPTECQSELQLLPSPTVSNSNTSSSSSSALSPGGTTESVESSHSPRPRYSYTATPESTGLMTRMHPHTVIHTHPVTPTFVTTLTPTAYHKNESGNVRGFERGHGYVQEQYGYHRYASGGGGPMHFEQPQPLPLVTPDADLVSAPVPVARTHAHETATSRLYPTASSGWVSVPAGRAHPQIFQSDVTPSILGERTTNADYRYPSHDHTHGRW